MIRQDHFMGRPGLWNSNTLFRAVITNFTKSLFTLLLCRQYNIEETREIYSQQTLSPLIMADDKTENVSRVFIPFTRYLNIDMTLLVSGSKLSDINTTEICCTNPNGSIRPVWLDVK
jgi:hypothetical protein